MIQLQFVNLFQIQKLIVDSFTAGDINTAYECTKLMKKYNRLRAAVEFAADYVEAHQPKKALDLMQKKAALRKHFGLAPERKEGD